jgi:hypothetical protein
MRKQIKLISIPKVNEASKGNNTYMFQNKPIQFVIGSGDTQEKFDSWFHDYVDAEGSETKGLIKGKVLWRDSDFVFIPDITKEMYPLQVDDLLVIPLDGGWKYGKVKDLKLSKTTFTIAFLNTICYFYG